MTPAPETPAPEIPAAQSAAWTRPLLEEQIHLLGRLAEMGMDIATTIHGQVKAAAAHGEAAASERAALDFARVARAVRLTLMLQGRLIKDLEERERQETVDADRAASRERIDRDHRAFEQRERLTRIVERIAGDACEHGREVQRLAGEAHERLDHDDVYGDILSHPASELIARVCKDLGLAPDWPRLSEEAWAREEITSGAAGWPLAGLAARNPRADDPAAGSAWSPRPAASP